MSGLVLSIFPGIGLLDMAFEEAGFCVVRGPDLLWGGDIRRFHPPAGKFDGVIGGPPCQVHSGMTHLCKLGNGVAAGERHGNMIPEFERCVADSEPRWFVMENVSQAPAASVEGYGVHSFTVNNRQFGEDQNRVRRFSFGMRGARITLCVETSVFESENWEGAVLAGHGPAYGQRVRGISGRRWQEMARLQGLPDAWIEKMNTETPLHVQGMKRVIGNGVPLPMGRAIAAAVKRALSDPEKARKM